MKGGYKMNKLKRLLALVLVMCFMTTSVVIISHAEETSESTVVSAYEEISAVTCGAYEGASLGVDPYGVPVMSGTVIGAWARYDNIDFGTGDVKEFLFRYGVNNDYAGGIVTVYIDGMDSEPVATMTLPGTGNWNTHIWVPTAINNSEIVGVHTVYLTFTGRRALGNISALKFSQHTDIGLGADYPSDIAGTEYEQAYALLTSVGIIDKTEDSSYFLNRKLTGEDLIKLAARVMNVADTPGIVEFLAERMEIDVTAHADLNAAAKLATYVMGYDEIARLEADYTGACMVRAEDNDVFDNVITVNGVMTRGDALQFAYNLVESDAAVFEKRGDTWVARSSGEESVLEYYHHIHDDTGVVDGNKYTDLTGPATVSDGYVMIDEIKYAVVGKDPTDMLGRGVKYYYTEDGNNRSLVHIEEYDNSIMVLEDEDMISYENMSFKYFDENDKIKTAKIDSSVDLIYNHVARIAYDDSIFDDFNGTLTLIDNDSDGKYEVIDMLDTYDMVINYITDNVIYEKAGSRKLDINDAVLIVKDQYGRKVEASELNNLASGNVITVAESAGADNKVYDITFAKKNATGVVDAVTSDGKVTIKGKTYSLSESVKYTTLNNDICVGDGVTIYLNAAGEVVLVNFMPTPKNYGYMLGAVLTGGMAEQVQVKIFTQDGEMKIFDCSSTVEIDSIPYRDGEEAATLMDTLCGTGTLVTYGITEGGYLKTLDFPYDYTGETPVGKNAEEKDNSLHMTFLRTSDTSYSSSAASFYGLAPTSDTSIIFCIPPSGTEQYYMVDKAQNVLKSGSYKAKAYSTDINKLDCEVFVLDQFTDDSEFFRVINSINATSGDIICYVNSLVSVYDDAKDDIFTEITYWNKGVLQTILADEVVMGTAPGLGVGDVVRIKSANGYAHNIEAIFDMDAKELADGVSNSFSSEKGCRYGTVEKRSGTFFKFNEYDEIYNLGLASVYVYEESRNGSPISVGSINDVLDSSAIRGGCELVINTYAGKVVSAFVIK